MNQLVIFYLMTSATQVIPLVVIALSLHYERPSPFLPKMPSTYSSLNHGLQKIGVSRFEQLYQLFDQDIMNYYARFSLIACVVQLITSALIILGIILEVPLPFMPHVDDDLIADVMYELLTFSLTASFMQLIPKICVDLAFFYGVPLPFIPRPPKNRALLSNEITRGEQHAEEFASIRLTRFENSAKIFYYAYCRDDRSAKIFKLVFCQGKEANAKPQCFVYTDDDESTLKQINPAPVSVNVLDEIFISGEQEEAL